MRHSMRVYTDGCFRMSGFGLPAAVSHLGTVFRSFDCRLSLAASLSLKECLMYALALIGRHGRERVSSFTSSSIEALTAHATHIQIGNCFRFEIRCAHTGAVVKAL